MMMIINGVVLIMVEVEVLVVCNILTTSDTENFTELESELTTIYAWDCLASVNFLCPSMLLTAQVQYMQ
jgi:hypothetical protein